MTLLVNLADTRAECAETLLPLSIEAAIQNALAHFENEDACNLAEALYAKEKTDSSLHTYAHCLIRAGETSAAYELMKRAGFERNGRIRYLFAKCAYDLQRLHEASHALSEFCPASSQYRVHDAFDEHTLPFAHKLLAKVHTELADLDRAKAHYALGLVANPLMLSAMTDFGRLGGESVPRLFAALADENEPKPAKLLRKQSERINRAIQRFANRPDSATPNNAEPLPAGARPSPGPGQKRKRTPTNPVTVGHARQSISPPRPTSKPTPNHAAGKEPAQAAACGPADAAVLNYALALSDAIHLLCAYRCHDALKVLNDIGAPFNKLSLTMRVKGMVLFELHDYSTCSSVLAELNRLYPSKIQGMELLSTAYWQLQANHKLSALAAELTQTHRMHPITWCVVGNSLSLEKHHEAAVEAFERAIQLDSRFGYAYSLLGNELIELNNLVRAIDAFKHAQIHSPNDYRALYGQGIIHYKTEDHQSAQVAFRKAVKINPHNVTLLCHLAIVEHALRRNGEAMEHLRQALQLEPNSVVCRYHRARILFDMNQFREAEKELIELRSLSPDEAHVFFLLGRVYRKLNNQHLAMLNFSWATEIDPRGEQNQSAISEQGPYDDDAADLTDADRLGAAPPPTF